VVGLYAPKTGEILYNGICVERWIWICCGKDRICYAGYATFSGSIRENLLFVNRRRRTRNAMEVLQQRGAQLAFAGGPGIGYADLAKAA